MSLTIDVGATIGCFTAFQGYMTATTRSMYSRKASRPREEPTCRSRETRGSIFNSSAADSRPNGRLLPRVQVSRTRIPSDLD